jgi:hypothetical protein
VSRRTWSGSIMNNTGDGERELVSLDLALCQIQEPSHFLPERVPRPGRSPREKPVELKVMPYAGERSGNQTTFGDGASGGYRPMREQFETMMRGLTKQVRPASKYAADLRRLITSKCDDQEANSPQQHALVEPLHHQSGKRSRE